MDESPLTSAQRSYLRGLGQKLEPALKLGRGGLTPEFLRELRQVLRAHELVKLRFLSADRAERAVRCEEIATQCPCVCVGAVGHTALFFLPHPEPEARQITLPGK